MGHITPDGDIFGMPLTDGTEALCRVLFKSQYFRNVILVGVYGRASGHDPISQIRAKKDPLVQIYASCESLDLGQWRYLGNAPVSDGERQLSKRVVGGEIWLRDEHLGPVGDNSQSLPQMDVYGDRVLQRKVERCIAV
jgi:hypothetical protein